MAATHPHDRPVPGPTPAHRPPPPPPAAPAPTRTGGPPRGKQVKWIAAILVLVAAAFFGYRYWRAESRFVTTDNAYVGANEVEVTAQVAGKVQRVYVSDHEKVKQGDALFDIDPSDYRLALEKARAQLELARQSTSEEGAAVHAAEAVLAQRRAEAANARSVWRRNQQLMQSGFLSPQGAETSRSQLQSAQAAVQAAQASVAQAKSALGQPGDRNAAVQAAQAAVHQAELDLARTRVTSPTAGTIANFSLRPGNTVQPGVPLFVVISNARYWVDANFKETQLKDIHPGEKAVVEVDMYPDHPFEGVVQSVAGGSGAAFSLLPPQNATGNWVKVTQRVPVRVRITNPDPDHPLRIGTTATVKVRKAT